MMKPSIKDIANDTGLSMATVSKYLNDISIRPENKIRIERAIKRLGYIPNPNARIHKADKSGTIAVIFAAISNPFWGSIVDYIEEYLKQEGYMTAIYSSQDIDVNPTKLAFIAAQNPDGIILTPSGQDDPAADYFRSKNIPVVLIDHKLMGKDFETVTSANFEGGYNAAEYLISKGHRRIGVVIGERDLYTVNKRLEGFYTALSDRNIHIPEIYICKGEPSGQEQFRHLMSLDEPPTAIFTVILDLGVGVLLEANSRGYKIGKDISLIAFDDDEIFSGCTPPVTVISQDVEKMGVMAAKLILTRIHSAPSADESDTYYIPTKMIERQSVADLNGKDR